MQVEQNKIHHVEISAKLLLIIWINVIGEKQQIIHFK